MSAGQIEVRSSCKDNEGNARGRLQRRPDYLNAITLGREEDYVPLIYQYLMNWKLPDEQELREKVIEEAEHFVLFPGDKGGKILHRKIRDDVTVPYVEYIFHGNLMEK